MKDAVIMVFCRGGVKKRCQSQEIIEIQGCAEKTPIDFDVLGKLYELSKTAVAKITELQNKAISG